MQKILIINIFGIGDVLFTTPLISNLIKQNPDCFIGYLGNRRTEPVLHANPYIKKVFIYERDEFNALYHQSKKLWWEKWQDLIQSIRAEHFDACIDLSLSTFMNFLTLQAGIKERIGYNYKNRSPFLTKSLPLAGYENEHVVEYYLKLLNLLGVKTIVRDLGLHISENDQQWAKNFLKENKISSDRLVGLVPGGGASWGKAAFEKRWPAENYAKLADKIIEKGHVDIILMGDSSEEQLCSQVASLMKHQVVNACGKTTVLTFGALARESRFFIVNDGGPLHLAVASGTQTLSIFGPVDENIYGPYPRGAHVVVKKDLACRPCYRRFRKASCEHLSCLRDISVEDVFKEAERLLAKGR